ncbi:hypothetical protein BC831DRAFT_489776 [Entophlyctis helioformis]|nr:hypothetical protein BC831DRAFT_489776 [Entophlyctis helioformis]
MRASIALMLSASVAVATRVAGTGTGTGAGAGAGKSTETRGAKPSAGPSDGRTSVFADYFGLPEFRLVMGTRHLSRQEADHILARSRSRTANAASTQVIQVRHAGSEFLCTLPLHPAVDDDDTSSVSWNRNNPQTEAVVREAWTRLAALPYACILHTDKLWDYEYCHGRYVRQYYDWPDKPEYKDAEILDYILGYASLEARRADLDAIGSAKDGKATSPAAVVVDLDNMPASDLVETDESGRHYLRQVWAHGDVCQETGEYRTVEVQFHCCTQQHISYMREYSVCKYVMAVHTPLMCFHPVFKTRERTASNQIECLQVAADDDALYRDHHSAAVMSIDAPVAESLATPASASASASATVSASAATGAASIVVGLARQTPAAVSVNDLIRSKCDLPVGCELTDETTRQALANQRQPLQASQGSTPGSAPTPGHGAAGFQPTQHGRTPLDASAATPPSAAPESATPTSLADPQQAATSVSSPAADSSVAGDADGATAMTKPKGNPELGTSAEQEAHVELALMAVRKQLGIVRRGLIAAFADNADYVPVTDGLADYALTPEGMDGLDGPDQVEETLKQLMDELELMDDTERAAVFSEALGDLGQLYADELDEFDQLVADLEAQGL